MKHLYRTYVQPQTQQPQDNLDSRVTSYPLCVEGGLEGGAGRGRGRGMRSAAMSPGVPRAPACVSCRRWSPPLSSVPRGPSSVTSSVPSSVPSSPPSPALTPCLMFIVSIFPVLHLQTIRLLPQHSTVSLTTAKECKSEYFHLEMQNLQFIPMVQVS